MLFDSPYFDPIAVPLSSRPDYPFLLGLASLLGLAYVLVTGWTAVKRMAYVNVREEGRAADSGGTGADGRPG